MWWKCFVYPTYTLCKIGNQKNKNKYQHISRSPYKVRIEG